MARDGRRARLAAALLGLVLVFEFAPALSLTFAGDDFELFALARIGGFSSLALFVPHRGGFVKPVLNIIWAALVAVFGTRAHLWHAALLAVHLLNTALLGLFATRLSFCCGGPPPRGPGGSAGGDSGNGSDSPRTRSGGGGSGGGGSDSPPPQDGYGAGNGSYSRRLRSGVGGSGGGGSDSPRTRSGGDGSGGGGSGAPPPQGGCGAGNGFDSGRPPGGDGAGNGSDSPGPRSADGGSGGGGSGAPPPQDGCGAGNGFDSGRPPGGDGAGSGSDSRRLRSGGGGTWAGVRGRDVATGLATAGIWAVHDRLSEPLFSLAALNHSVAFTFYLTALLGILGALRTRAARDRLVAALVMLLALFSYEVAVSLVPVAILLVAVHAIGPDLPSGRRRQLARPSAPAADRIGPLRESLAAIGPALGLAALAYGAVQLLSRLGPGAAGFSYYTVSPSLAATNLSEIALSFLHVRSDWIEPGALPAAVLGAMVLLALVLLRDPVVRFGLAWGLASWLPVAAIPSFSDRYHYIAFAGPALAAGRAVSLALTATSTPEAPAGGRDASRAGDAPQECRLTASYLLPGTGRAAVALALAAHLLWSLGGSHELARYHDLRGAIPAQLLTEARAALDAPGVTAARSAARRNGAAPGGDPGASAPRPDGEDAGDDAVIAIVWDDDPGFYARFVQSREGAMGTPPPGSFLPPIHFGERSHPVYVRPEAVLGAVYPLDLFNMAGSERGRFFRMPEASVAAGAIARGRLRVVPIGRGRERRPELSAGIGRAIRDALLERREVPVRLPPIEGGARAPLRIAYAEPTDRQGAFDAEYGETSAGRTVTSAAPSGGAP